MQPTSGNNGTTPHEMTDSTSSDDQLLPAITLPAAVLHPKPTAEQEDKQRSQKLAAAATHQENGAKPVNEAVDLRASILCPISMQGHQK